MHIVVVEDHEVLAKPVVRVLRQEGYTTTRFVDGREASTWLLGYRKAYDLILLGVLLPGMHGIAISFVRWCGKKVSQSRY